MATGWRVPRPGHHGARQHLGRGASAGRGRGPGRACRPAAIADGRSLAGTGDRL